MFLQVDVLFLFHLLLLSLSSLQLFLIPVMSTSNLLTVGLVYMSNKKFTSKVYFNSLLLRIFLIINNHKAAFPQRKHGSVVFPVPILLLW